MDSFLRQLQTVWTPHPGQKEFLTCPAKIRVLACGRRWGKTDACAAAIVGELFAGPPSRILILAPTLDQAKILFERVIELLHRFLDECVVNSPHASDEDSKSVKTRWSPYPKLIFREHSVTARSGHIGRSLRGNEATHIVVDEAAYVPEELVTEVAMPMLATNNGRLTLISTPNGLNHFWRFFKMGELGEHGVWSRTSPSSESPHVSKEFLEIQRQLISQRAFEIEYEAQFVDASGTMFGAEMVESCVVPEVQRDDAPATVGIDWGRYRDYTAVAVLQGGRSCARLVAIHQFNKVTWQEMVDRAAEIIAPFPGAKVIADGTGTGDAVCEMYDRKVGRPLQIFAFTNKDKRQLIEGLRAGMERGAIAIPPEPELIRQLKHFEVALSTSGNQLMNAKSGYHDDLVIALALAYSVTPADYTAPVLVGASRSFSDHRKLCFDDLDWSNFTP